MLEDQRHAGVRHRTASFNNTRPEFGGKCDHAPLRWCIHRAVEAPHAVDATIPRMFNSYNLLLRIRWFVGKLVEEPLLVLRLGLLIGIVFL